MSYQIPSYVKAEILGGDTKSPMYLLTPTEVVKIQHTTVTMYLKGLIGASFQMRINVYKDSAGRNLLCQSNAINVQDIPRTGDYYCEVRFDFPVNTMQIGKAQLIEFEVFDGYAPDGSNFVALILGTQESLGFLGSDLIQTDQATFLGHRISMFFGRVEQQLDDKYFMVRIDGGKILDRTVLREFFSSGGDSGIIYGATIQKGIWIDPLDDEAVTMVQAATSPSSLDEDDTVAEFTRVYSPIVPTSPYSAQHKTYYYDPVTGEFQMFIDSNTPEGGGPLIFGNGWSIHMKYSLFFTEHVGRYASALAQAGGNIYYQPRLLGSMEFGFNQQNAFAGILSITASGITIKNEDRYLNTFFGQDDSFSNRQVKVWSCVGQDPNPRLEFVGTIRSASLSDQVCTFDVQDLLATLDVPYRDAHPDTWRDMSYIGVTPGCIAEEDLDLPVPRMYGLRGPTKVEYYDPTGVADFRQLPALSGEAMIRAVNVSRNASLSTSVNRTWSVGFGPGNASDVTVDVTLHQQGVAGSYSESRLTIDTAPLFPKELYDYFSVGDTIKNGSQYGIVYEVTSTQLRVWPYNASFSASNDVVRKKVAAVVIKKGDDLYYALGGRDYNCSIGTDGDLRIVFVNNFEANLSGLGTLDPDAVEIYAKPYNDSAPNTVSAILEDILSQVKTFEVASDFAPAQQAGRPGGTAYEGAMPNGDSYPDPILGFSLPFAGESAMPTFREVIEKILRTGMGFIYFDNDAEIRYKSFLDRNWLTFTSFPATEGELTTEYIDNQSGLDPDFSKLTESRSGSFSVQYDLYDTYAGVEFDFSHQPRGITKSFIGAARRLYKTNKLYQVESLVDINASLANSFLNRFVLQVTGRRSAFNLESFITRTAYLGDDLLVKRAKILGTDDEVIMRIVAISRSSNSQKLTLLDQARFRGLNTPTGF